jgi:hypothetical protein
VSSFRLMLVLQVGRFLHEMPHARDSIGAATLAWAQQSPCWLCPGTPSYATAAACTFTQPLLLRCPLCLVVAGSAHLTADSSPRATLSQCGPLRPPTGERYKLFLCHAGEQKRCFVDFLRARLESRYPGVRFFLDEYAMKPADGAMEEIHAALGDALVGASDSCIPASSTRSLPAKGV